jgi:hypothetical protein
MHTQTWEICDDAFEVMNEYKRSPIIGMPPQSGKTALCAAMTYRFAESAGNNIFEVIIISCISDCNLRDQTNDRMTFTCNNTGDGREGYLLNGILLTMPNNRSTAKDGFHCEHITGLNRIVPAKVDRRLILLDEADMGANRDGNLDRFLLQFGIDLSKPISNWDQGSTRNYVMPVSATPFAYVALSENAYASDSQLFRMIYRAPTSDYNGLTHMLESGRLLQNFELILNPNHGFGDSSFTPEGEEMISRFLRDCQKDGPGYLVIRSPGSTNSRNILDSILQQRNHLFDIKHYDDDNKNITKMANHLIIRPDRPTVFLIKNAWRAGMTIKPGSHIRGWYEPSIKNSNRQGADTVVQSGAGRACGYGKKEDVYPIYTNLEKVCEYIYYLPQTTNGPVASIPNGRGNGSHQSSVQERICTFGAIMSPEEGAIEIDRRKDSTKNVRHHIARTSRTTFYGKYLSDILANKKAGISPNTLAIHFDGPNPEGGIEEESNYKRLIEEDPNREGNYVFLEWVTKFIHPSNKIRMRSMLYNGRGNTSFQEKRQARAQLELEAANLIAKLDVSSFKTMWKEIWKRITEKDDTQDIYIAPSTKSDIISMIRDRLIEEGNIKRTDVLCRKLWNGVSEFMNANSSDLLLKKKGNLYEVQR